MEMNFEGVVYKAVPEIKELECDGCVFLDDFAGGCFVAASFKGPNTCSDNQVIWVLKQETPETVKVEPTVVSDTKSKETNPKDAVGITKSPLSTVPTQVLHEVGLAMLEGALKYGRHNYRIAGVRYSVYYDGVQRHLNAFNEGQDIDPDSDISHITKAIAGLMVLRDAMLNDKWNDDRPPKPKNPGWMDEMNAKTKLLLAKYPEPKEAFTEKGK